MIDEMRRTYADVANRRHFTKEGQPITDTRHLMDELTAPPTPVDYVALAAQSATRLKQAADSGFVEVG